MGRVGGPALAPPRRLPGPKGEPVPIGFLDVHGEIDRGGGGLTPL
nr:MAG TPA: Late transcription unit A [Caudoviricetes sp.]